MKENRLSCALAVSRWSGAYARWHMTNATKGTGGLRHPKYRKRCFDVLSCARTYARPDFFARCASHAYRLSRNVSLVVLRPRSTYGLERQHKADYSYDIDFYRERGARGVGELQAHMMIDDPRVLGLFMHCEKKHFPVTIHFGKPDVGQGLVDDIGLVRLEKVLQQFSKLTILAHLSQRANRP